MNFIKKLFFILLISAILTGCGTILGLANGNTTPYVGVQIDYYLGIMAVHDPDFTDKMIGVGLFFDLPLSFACDTIILPVTGTMYLID